MFPLSGYIDEAHHLGASALVSSPATMKKPLTTSECENDVKPTPMSVTAPMHSMVTGEQLGSGNSSNSNPNTRLNIPTLINMPNTEVVVASGGGSFPTSISMTDTSTNMETNLPITSSNDSKPVRDLKLEAALNGQEPTVRNLIMAAIGVMKNRKVNCLHKESSYCKVLMDNIKSLCIT